MAEALQNSTVSKDGNWSTFEEVPYLMQYKGAAFYLRKRINGNVYTRSLKFDVFSVAHERIPKNLTFELMLDPNIKVAPKEEDSPR